MPRLAECYPSDTGVAGVSSACRDESRRLPVWYDEQGGGCHCDDSTHREGLQQSRSLSRYVLSTSDVHDGASRSGAKQALEMSTTIQFMLLDLHMGLSITTTSTRMTTYAMANMPVWRERFCGNSSTCTGHTTFRDHDQYRKLMA